MQAEVRTQEKYTIGVLYGFRALMVLFVCNFHIWQQGWLGQYVVLFGGVVNFDYWTRSSYLFVDGMMLLSGFLLYLPHARRAEYGTPEPGAAQFYWNRFCRVVPSSVVTVLAALLLIGLPGGFYPDTVTLNQDLLAHLTFTFTFFPRTYLFSPLNGVLWTVAIELQFYLIFPWLAKAARTKPARTLIPMACAGMLFRLLLARSGVGLAMWVNQLPAFLDVYALGMAGALAYVRLQKWREDAVLGTVVRRVMAWCSPALFAVGCWILARLLHLQSENGLAGAEAMRLSQWVLRLPMAATVLLLMLAAAFSPRPLQKLLDNRLMRFLSGISFQLYLWHQMLSVLIARTLYPSTLHSDPMLQAGYTLFCYAASLVVAMAATYGLEQPAARLLERARRMNQHDRETKRHEGSKGTDIMPPTDPVLVRDEGGSTGTD